MRAKRPHPLWMQLITDILITGLLLVVFAYFHHVRPTQLKSENVIIPRPTVPVAAAVTNTPAPEATPTAAPQSGEPAATAEPVPVAEDWGSFAGRFPDRFTSGGVESGEEDGVYYYRSPCLDITVTVSRISAKSTSGTYESTCYVTDFYIRDISCLSTGLANGKYGTGQYEWLKDMSQRAGAVVAINGDFYGARKNGVVIRNGELFRSNHSTFDACVIYWDGVMATYAPSQWDAKTLVKDGAYQAWSFGPRLLDESGQPMTTFNTTKAVKERNPRTAIGYFEPGHYCFVTVDGRTTASRGLTLEALANFMYELGCKAAYNLDGGESSCLMWQDSIISKPYKDGRKISDAVFLVESKEAQP